MSAAEGAVRVAKEGPATTGPAGQHLRYAEQSLKESRQRAAAGDNLGASLSLARAEADAELSAVLQRREKALADAEVVEGHLAETRSSAGKEPPKPDVPTPLPAAPGSVTPGPMSDPVLQVPSSVGGPATPASSSASTPASSTTRMPPPAPKPSSPTQPASPSEPATPRPVPPPGPTAPAPGPNAQPGPAAPPASP